MRIKFLGATNTVTGSKTLLTEGDTTILVDCGLFQGYKMLRLRNWDAFPVPPSKIDAVLLTHAHLDHSGYLPLLVRQGFKGKIYCSAATFDLCKILLPDSGHLQEEEAAFANRHQTSKHHPAVALYTEADAIAALAYFSPVDFNTRFSPASGLYAELFRAGHILGAASIRIQSMRAHTSITFSGDLGRANDAIMLAPATPPASDYLVLESTYGDRHHEQTDPTVLLGKTIRETASRGGVTIIPSFAVGRAQTLLYYIHQLKSSGAIPSGLPVYINSPMANNATEVYLRHREDHRLDAQQAKDMCHAAHIINTVEESIALNARQQPMVIIAASGMATGGRVLHHLKAFAGDPRNTVLFSGYQAGGTRGASMIAGQPSIKIYGEQVAIRAHIAQIENLSAHADQGELLAWLGNFKTPPKHTFITHGEPTAADELRRQINARLHWSCSVPDYLESAELV